MKVFEALPAVLVPVMVYAVAGVTVVGVPLRVPVAVSKVMPAGAAGVIVKLTIPPPVDVTVSPIAAVFTVTVSLEDERVNAGAFAGPPKARIGRT